MDGKTEEVKHMEKVVTSDPGLRRDQWAGLEQGGWTQGRFPGPSVWTECCPLWAFPHLPPAPLSESWNEDMAQGGEGHSCRARNQKQRQTQVSTTSSPWALSCVCQSSAHLTTVRVIWLSPPPWIAYEASKRLTFPELANWNISLHLRG